MAHGSMRKLIDSIKTMCMDEGDLYCNIRDGDFGTTIEIKQRREGGRGLHDMNMNMNMNMNINRHNVDNIPPLPAAAAALHARNDDNHVCTVTFKRSSSSPIPASTNGNGGAVMHHGASAVAAATTAAAAAMAQNQDYNNVHEMEMHQSFRVLIKKVAGNSEEFQKIVKSIKYHTSNLI